MASKRKADKVTSSSSTLKQPDSIVDKFPHTPQTGLFPPGRHDSNWSIPKGDDAWSKMIQQDHARSCALDFGRWLASNMHCDAAIEPAVACSLWDEAKLNIAQTHGVVPDERSMLAFMMAFWDRLETIRRDRSTYRCSRCCRGAGTRSCRRFLDHDHSSTIAHDHIDAACSNCGGSIDIEINVTRK